MKKLIYILSGMFMCLLFAIESTAQTCSTDFTVKTDIVASTCLSNGRITVTLEGNDLSNIFNVQYGLTSTTSGGYTVSPQISNVLDNVPPGTYTLTVRAFCQIDSEYSVVKTLENVVVGGSYVTPSASLNSTVSRKSYTGCNPTGIIALDVINGSGNFTFSITAAPSGVTTGTIVPTVSGNTYTFPGSNYPSGNYKVQIVDDCISFVADFTLGSMSTFPVFTTQGLSYFYPDVDNTKGSCNYVKWLAASGSLSSNSDFKRYFDDGLYEVGASKIGEMPTNWTTWTSNSTSLSSATWLNLGSYTVADFLSSGTNTIQVYIRVKDCSAIYDSFTTYMSRPVFLSPTPTRYTCSGYYTDIDVYDNQYGLFCYPLKVKVEKSLGSGTYSTVYENNNWLYSVNDDDQIGPLEYLSSYRVTIADQNNTSGTSTLYASRQPSVTTTSTYGNYLYCDRYQPRYYFASDATYECLPFTVSLENPSGTEIYTKTYTTSAEVQAGNTSGYFNLPDLEYGVNYVLKTYYATDNITYSQSVTRAKPTFATAYTLSVTNANACIENRASLNIKSNYIWPAGTKFVITGPAGYTSQTYTDTSTTGTTMGIVLGVTSLPAGVYTLTVDHGCNEVFQTTLNLESIYSYKDFDYTATPSCSGLVIEPTGTMTYLGDPTTTYYRLTDGPTGYDSSPISPGGTVTLSAAGTYTLSIYSGTSSSCVMASKTIEYDAAPMSINTDATSGYVCVGGSVGNIIVEAIDGVGPYAYELWDADNTTYTGLSYSGSDAVHFAYGAAGESYTVRITDQCGTYITQKVSLIDLQTAKIVYATNTTVCTGGTIELKCLTLGNTTYEWTGPNGFTSSDQNPVIANAQAGMTGLYKVTVQPEYCGTPIEDEIYITVSSLLVVTPGTETQEVTVCTGGSISLNGTVTGGGSTITYQWQSSSDNLTWSDISGATSTTYSPSVQSKGVYYYRRVTSDDCTSVYSYIVLNVNSCFIPVNPNIRSNVKK
jgi:hypothetical protein